MAPMLSIRDPIHGFIRADALETELIKSLAMQRLRFVRQLGFSFLIFPGAEHSRFSHVLGTMHLAGRVYDVLAAKSDGELDPDPWSRDRRLVRAAALLHDIGHAPFSHSAEDLFEGGIDHEEMTAHLLETSEMKEVFDRQGAGVDAASIRQVLQKSGEGRQRLLSEIVTGELDVDKMDYLLRDSLYCGVRYGSYDLERLLDTITPIRDPLDGAWRLGVDHGGVHALEALVMARYYMFTQVYFNVTGKVMELHFNEWLRSQKRFWPADPKAFLTCDDVSMMSELRASDHLHARAIIHRERFVLAFETEEHLDPRRRQILAQRLPELSARLGPDQVLIGRAAKKPHQLGRSRVLVKRFDGSVQPMEEASDFIRHLSRIDSYRVYTARPLKEQVSAELRNWI